MPVEFRTLTPPPDAPGFYYARQHGFVQIRVVEVMKAGVGGGIIASAGLRVYRIGTEYPVAMRLFDWFGPVMEVREG
jgi:hypothetical protein